jgi:hypothetical protein
MSRPIKTAAGTEAQMLALQATIDKALGYPRKGVSIGTILRLDVPDTWDGTGPTPLGWTKSATIPWVNSAADAVLPLPDDLAAELQVAPAQARLTGLERAAVSGAISSRGSTVLDGRTPKEPPIRLALTERT